MKIRADGVERTIDVPTEDYGHICLTMPQMGQPAALADRSNHGQTEICIKVMNGFVFGKRPMENAEAITQIESGGEIRITEFQKLLAKIAHGYLVGEEGLEAHDWLLPPLITGEDNNHSDLIGGVRDISQDDLKSMYVGQSGLFKFEFGHTLQRINAVSLAGQWYMGLNINLFHSLMPTYTVLAAKIPIPTDRR